MEDPVGLFLIVELADSSRDPCDGLFMEIHYSDGLNAAEKRMIMTVRTMDRRIESMRSKPEREAASEEEAGKQALTLAGTSPT